MSLVFNLVPMMTQGGVIPTTWKQSNITSDNFNSVYFDGTIWVAAGSSGLYWSDDGKKWTFSGTSGNFRTVYFDGRTWLAGGDSSWSCLFWSKDGKTWEEGLLYA